MTWLRRWSRQLLPPQSDNPELRKAQFEALSRLVPLSYVILMANTWVLTATFYDIAPLSHTLLIAFALTVVCVARFVSWWRRKSVEITAERARRELRRSNIAGAILGVVVSAWGVSLYPYGDAYAHAHILFFLTVSITACMFCLIHNLPAALVVALVPGILSLAFFSTSGVPALVGMVINQTLVIAAAIVVVIIQNRDFTSLINARTEARLREHDQNRLLRMIDDMPVAVMTVDPATFQINYANKTSERTLQRIEHLLPVSGSSLLGASIDVFNTDPEQQRRVLGNPKNLPFQTRVQIGPEVLDLQASAVTGNDGGYLGPMLTWGIVTREVAAENRIRQLAHFDALTELPNRYTFREHLDACFGSPRRRASLLLIDLDGFKLVNDTRGHHAGDELLRQVAVRLRNACTQTDVTVARLGGDEFAVLLNDDCLPDAEALAATLVEALGAPYHVDHDRNVRIGASVGVALAPIHGETSEILLAHADIALYAAKAAGRSATRTFSEDMEVRIRERVRLEAKLRSALDTNEGLFVFYQPIINLETNACTAKEALVRWHHREHGWVSPAEFVPVAEESGLIEQLGAFVLNQACRHATQWPEHTRVAVNVSAAQLGKSTLVKSVMEALSRSGLPAHRLELEITETALLSHATTGIDELRRLRELGIRVALDDFGTGYSSLAHLRAFPFDKIKIDGSFVRDAVERPDCAAVVRAVAELGKRLGVTTVAEGVETHAQLHRIREEGCTEVQGYLFGRPMPSEVDQPLIEALSRPPASSQRGAA
jgi:diguanylate cyclase (GGDEF)-like protein